MGEEKNLQPEELNQEKANLETEQEKTTEVKNETTEFDYSAATREDLIKRLSMLIDSQSALDIKSEIDTLKRVFYQKMIKEVAELKVAFLKNDGKEEDFKVKKDELEPVFKAELARYKTLKNEAYALLEKERENNLKLKEELIEELKQLVEKEESLKETFEAFHIIQDKWRSIGSVPTSANDDMWQNYHLQVEHFYDYIKINKDLRDLDFKRNLEKKERLCEKAEALSQHASAIEAFRTLQVFHQEWKETGPVSKELREPLWERFKTVTSVINKRHQDHFAHLKEQHLENLKKKEELCEQVEAIAEFESDKIKDWNRNAKVIQELQGTWRTIGQVPKQDNAAIYRRFRKACDLFFKNKRLFHKKQKDEQIENLEKKKVLLEQAVQLKDSEDWKETTEKLIEIQKEWKEIGPVPRKYSDKIWDEFRGACDHFFEKKKDFYGDSEEKQKENLALKNALIEKIKAFVPTDSPKEDITTLLSFKDEWLEIGHVPIKDKNKVNSEYHNVLNAQFDRLNMEKEDREIEKFRSKLDDMTSNHGDKLYSERKKLSMQLGELQSDISTLENNIGFLSKSKSTEVLVKEYTSRIEKAKKQFVLLKKKIRMIDNID